MIAIGADHGGYDLKEIIKEYLDSVGEEYKDFGTFNGESCDYPDIAEVVANSVVSGEAKCGILVCGTGIGISIAANKVKGIRCAHCTDSYSAKMTKVHNDANIIALGGRITGPEVALDIVRAYLGAEFEGGRHERRVNKIMELENK